MSWRNNTRRPDLQNIRTVSFQNVRGKRHPRNFNSGDTLSRHGGLLVNHTVEQGVAKFAKARGSGYCPQELGIDIWWIVRHWGLQSQSTQYLFSDHGSGGESERVYFGSWWDPRQSWSSKGSFVPWSVIVVKNISRKFIVIRLLIREINPEYEMLDSLGLPHSRLGRGQVMSCTRRKLWCFGAQQCADDFCVQQNEPTSKEMIDSLELDSFSEHPFSLKDPLSSSARSVQDA